MRGSASPSGFGQKQPRKNGAEGYGIERIPVDARVRHSVFGEGTIISSRDMGGDILYEIAFDKVGTKKLMATYARLKKADQ
jgi:DNA helicase-2/ATP-dependent DNA helicase PcrA